jgi:hypothetical protein
VPAFLDHFGGRKSEDFAENPLPRISMFTSSRVWSGFGRISQQIRGFQIDYECGLGVGEALNRALLVQFLVQATLYLNCCCGSPEKGLYLLFMMFGMALFSAMAARGDDRPQATAKWAAGAVHLYLIYCHPPPGAGSTKGHKNFVRCSLPPSVQYAPDRKVLRNQVRRRRRRHLHLAEWRVGNVHFLRILVRSLPGDRTT